MTRIASIRLLVEGENVDNCSGNRDERKEEDEDERCIFIVDPDPRYTVVEDPRDVVDKRNHAQIGHTTEETAMGCRLLLLPFVRSHVLE